MATNLDIANRAIREAGGQPITQTLLDTPTTATSKITSEAFVGSIEEVLSEYQWHINLVTESSTGVTTGMPDTVFAYNHDLSALANTLDRLVTIFGSDGVQLTNWRMEGQALHTDYETIYIQYTFPMTSVATFPPYLSSLIAIHLARSICIPLTGDENRRALLDNKYMSMLSKAKTQASRQNPPQTFMDDSSSTYISAHQGYGRITPDNDSWATPAYPHGV